MGSFLICSSYSPKGRGTPSLWDQDKKTSARLALRGSSVCQIRLSRKRHSADAETDLVANGRERGVRVWPEGVDGCKADHISRPHIDRVVEAPVGPIFALIEIDNGVGELYAWLGTFYVTRFFEIFFERIFPCLDALFWDAACRFFPQST